MSPIILNGSCGLLCVILLSERNLLEESEGRPMCSNHGLAWLFSLLCF